MVRTTSRKVSSIAYVKTRFRIKGGGWRVWWGWAILTNVKLFKLKTVSRHTFYTYIEA